MHRGARNLSWLFVIVPAPEGRVSVLREEETTIMIMNQPNKPGDEKQQPRRPTSRRGAPLTTGTQAPDFQLPATPDQRIGPVDFRGQPLIIAFYPADWSPVCSDQMALYQEVLPEFQRYDAALVGISCDGVWCHLAFAKERKLHYPLLSDFEPKGMVSRLYGSYREGEGVSERALFVLDADGLVFWSYVSPVGVNPGADGILRALDELKTSKVSS